MVSIKKGITLEAVLNSTQPTIFYSSRTIWWTDDPKDLQGTGLPLDVFGAPLFEAPKKDWINAAIFKPDHYGEGGLEILMACHHKNFDATSEHRADFTNFKLLNHIFSTMKIADANFTLTK
jgi:hypothetical protein